MLRAGQGRTRHDQPGPLRDPNTKWPDRGAAVRRYVATKLMAERSLEPTIGDLRDEDVEGRDWERVRPRRISEADWQRFEGYMSEILRALGMPLDTPGTEKTPHRYLRAMFESTEGYEGDSKLVTAFPTACHGGPHCDGSQVRETLPPFYAPCGPHA